MLVISLPNPADMTQQEIYDKIAEIRTVIDEMMTEYFALHCMAARFEGECLPDQIHMTEFLTICAWQTFNDAGQRGGDVRVLVRDGSIPLYVARGMISSAMEHVNRVSACCCGEVDEDGA